MPVPRSLRLLPLLLVAVLTLAATAAPANAASPGINVLNDISPGNVQRALDTGAAEVRLFVSWNGFEPNSAGEFKDFDDSNIGKAIRGAVQQVKSANRRVMLNVLDSPAWANGGSPSPHIPPTRAHYGDYASFVARLLRKLADAGAPVDKVEIWNEEDNGEFWLPSADPAGYTGLLKASYAAIKNPTTGSPSTQVYVGPTAGNNYAFIQQLYDNGAKDAFDGVSVHTDTACLVTPPDGFYRENGRLARFTFLGYREVHATMEANGDGAKPISMSELGWSSTNGSDTSCGRGAFAGKKANGVSQTEQAQYLTQAFQCMANDPYLTGANWFHLQDTSTSPSEELGHYGLFSTTGAAKPSLAAFKAVTAAGGGSAGPCGDFDGPSLRITKPADNSQFVDKLDIQAVAADTGVGLGRVTFYVDGANDEIRNFTADLANNSPVGLTPWQGSGKLALGKHTITATALDKNGNATSTSVTVEKVPEGMLKATLTPKAKLPKKVSCKRGVCKLSGSLLRGTPGSPSIGGKVAVEWQWRNKQGKWRKLSGGLKPASKAFTFTLKPKKKGAWRVRIVYKGQAPWKAFSSKYIAFRVR